LPETPGAEQTALALLHAYDYRCGGVETQNRNDKQGLGLTRRNKRSCVAQEMLVLLAQLAHNFVIWARNDLVRTDARWRKFGIQRLVRDAFQIAGRISFSETGQLQQITLNQSHPLAAAVQLALARDDLPLNLGKIQVESLPLHFLLRGGDFKYRGFGQGSSFRILNPLI
jgi:hypothetical protein